MADDVDSIVDALAGQPAGMDVQKARLLWRMMNGAQQAMPSAAQSGQSAMDAAAQDRELMAAQVGGAAQHLGIPRLGPQDLATDLAPLALGPAGKMVGAFPKIAAGLGATAATTIPMAQEGESIDRLSRAQIQLLREKNAANKDALNIDTQRATIEQSQREADRQFQLKNEADARQRAAQEEHDKRYATFQQKYPILNESLPAIGATAAGLIPYLGRAGNIIAQRAASKPWFDAITRGELAKTLPATAENAGERAASRAELTHLSGPTAAQPPQVAPTSPWLKAAGAGAGIESALVQPEYNAAMLPADSPDKYPDPYQLMVRSLMGGLAGGAPALIGSHLPVPITPATVPMSRIAGLAKALDPPRPKRPPKSSK